MGESRPNKILNAEHVVLRENEVPRKFFNSSKAAHVGILETYVIIFYKDVSRRSNGTKSTLLASYGFFGLIFQCLSFHYLRVRSLRCESLGGLITLKGTVTRTSDVRPELKKASFECNNCHATVINVEQQFKFTEPSSCCNSECKNRNSWTLKHESCEFEDWQKLR